MRKDEVENLIRTKGLTAPRIKPEDVDAKIVHTNFAVFHDVLTICILKLTNGFTVTGESACASPENFDAEIGCKISLANAKAKIWMLEGYLLREKLSGRMGSVALALSKVVVQPHGAMEQYVGTKVINAMPMTRGDYNIIRGWQLPADEDGRDMGYLVEYTDAQRPNAPGFDGYISWSPADVFEGAYAPTGSPHEEPELTEGELIMKHPESDEPLQFD